MNNSFDGKSFKRTPNRTGEKTPVIGIKKVRAIFTAAGGETSVNTGTLSPAVQYTPGQNLLTVKRSTVPSLMSGVHFFETGPTIVTFSTPLAAGEKVEFTKEADIVATLALSPKPDIYTSVATSGQTLVNADFFWPYNQNMNKARGAVRVEVNGVSKDRGTHYTEVAGTSSLSSSIQFINPLSAGERITLQPTNQVVDNAIPLSSTHSAEITSLKARATALEAASGGAPAAANIVAANGTGTNITTSSTVFVDTGIQAQITTTGKMFFAKLTGTIAINATTTPGFVQLKYDVIRVSDSTVVASEYCSSHGGLKFNEPTNMNEISSPLALPAGTYLVKVRWVSSSSSIAYVIGGSWGFRVWES